VGGEFEWYPQCEFLSYSNPKCVFQWHSHTIPHPLLQWDAHQKVDKPSPSRFPEVPDNTPNTSREVRETFEKPSREVREPFASSSPPGIRNLESGIGNLESGNRSMARQGKAPVRDAEEGVPLSEIALPRPPTPEEIGSPRGRVPFKAAEEMLLAEGWPADWISEQHEILLNRHRQDGVSNWHFLLKSNLVEARGSPPPRPLTPEQRKAQRAAEETARKQALEQANAGVAALLKRPPPGVESNHGKNNEGDGTGNRGTPALAG
jgi:hypothetical protein